MDSINFFELQDIGQRDEQQDSIANSTIDFENGFRLHVLADGMGGHSSGSLASQMVCESFLKYFERNSLQSPENDLRKALNYANDRISHYIEDNPDSSGMGTTVIALIYNEKSNQYSYLSVGDSPLYLYNSNGLKRINENHAYYEKLKKMAQAGVISQEEADTDPQRHAVTSAVMGEPIKEVDVQTGVLKENEFLLLASDGIQTLDDSEKGELAQILDKYENDIDKVLYKLVDELRNKNNEFQDNTSLILIRHYSEPKLKKDIPVKGSEALVQKPITTPIDNPPIALLDSKGVETDKSIDEAGINKEASNNKDFSLSDKKISNSTKSQNLVKYLLLFGFLLLMIGSYLAWSVYKCSGSKSLKGEDKTFICNLLDHKDDDNKKDSNKQDSANEQSEEKSNTNQVNSDVKVVESKDQESMDMTSNDRVKIQDNSSNKTSDEQAINDLGPKIEKVEIKLTEEKNYKGNIFDNTDCNKEFSCEIDEILHNGRIQVNPTNDRNISMKFKPDILATFKIKNDGQYEIKAKKDQMGKIDMKLTVKFKAKDMIANPSLNEDSADSNDSINENTESGLSTITVPAMILVGKDSRDSDIK